MQLKIKYYDNIVFEWIPYEQFNNIHIKATNKNELSIIYTAIWRNTPHYDNVEKKWKRDSDIVILNSQNTVDRCLNKV